MKCGITDQNTRIYHVYTDIKASVCVCVCVIVQATAARLICKLTGRLPSAEVHANYMRLCTTSCLPFQGAPQRFAPRLEFNAKQVNSAITKRWLESSQHVFTSASKPGPTWHNNKKKPASLQNASKCSRRLCLVILFARIQRYTPLQRLTQLFHTAL